MSNVSNVSVAKVKEIAERFHMSCFELNEVEVLRVFASVLLMRGYYEAASLLAKQAQTEEYKLQRNMDLQQLDPTDVYG